MVNLLRMDMYQLFKGTAFRVFLLIIIGFSIMSVWGMWFVQTSTYEDMLQEELTSEGGFTFGIINPVYEDGEGSQIVQSIPALSDMNQIEAIGSALISGGGLTVIILLFVAIVISGEFNSGFIKNVFTAQKSRIAYFASKVITMGIAATILTTAAVLVSLAGYILAGLDFAFSSVGDFISWMAVLILLFTAMSLLVALVAWFTRSKVAAVLAAVFIGGAILLGLINAVLSLFPGYQDLSNYTLLASLLSISGGLSTDTALSTAHVLSLGVAALVLYGVLGIVTLKRKDI